MAEQGEPLPALSYTEQKLLDAWQPLSPADKAKHVVRARRAVESSHSCHRR